MKLSENKYKTRDGQNSDGQSDRKGLSIEMGAASFSEPIKNTPSWSFTPFPCLTLLLLRVSIWYINPPPPNSWHPSTLSRLARHSRSIATSLAEGSQLFLLNTTNTTN